MAIKTRKPRVRSTRPSEKEMLERMTPEQANAWLAARRFRAMKPGLQSLCRSISGNPRLVIEVNKQDSGVYTQGNKIVLPVPAGLGEETQHDLMYCGDRDDVTDVPTCQACRVKETLMVNIYHELAHHLFESFAKPNEKQTIQALKMGVQRYKNTYARRTQKEIDAKALDLNANSFFDLCNMLSPYMPFLLNTLEDARVNDEMFESRPGLRRMFAADIKAYMETGVKDIRTGEYKTWQDGPINSQISVALFCHASGYDYTGWFSPQVEEDMKDPILRKLAESVGGARNVSEVYGLAIPVLNRLQELGYLITPEEQEADPELEMAEDRHDQDEQEDQDGKKEEDSENGSEDGDSDSRDDLSRGEESAESGTEESEQSDDAGTETSSGEDSGDSESGDSESGESGGDEGDADDADSGSDTGSTDADGDSSEGDTAESGTGEIDSDSESGQPEDAADGEAGGNGSDSDSVGTGDDSDGSSGVPDESSDESSDSGSSGSSSGGSPGTSEGSDQERSPGQSASGEDRSVDSDSERQAGSDQTGESTDSGNWDDSSGTDARQDTSGTEDNPNPEDSDDPFGEDSDSDWLDQQEDRGSEDGGSAEFGDQGDGNELPEEDPRAIRIHRWEERGTPEQVAKDLQQFGRHQDIEGNDIESAFKPADGDEQQNLSHAANQSEYFETPSVYVAGINFHDFGTGTGEAWNELDYWSGREDMLRRRGIILDESVPENVLGRSLLRARLTFDANRRKAVQRNLRSGEIDAKKLARRAPIGDERVFTKSRRPGRRDYHVLIGVDISGSTVGENIKLAKLAALGQAELCNRVGIKFEIWAHTTDGGYGGMYMAMYKIKGLHEPWDKQRQDALTTIAGAQGNLDGHALEFFRKQMDKSQATDKIIMYYSDGKMPATNYEEELEILQDEIATCAKRNIHLMGVGIRTDSPTEHGLETVQIDDISELEEVVKFLQKKLA